MPGLRIRLCLLVVLGLATALPARGDERTMCVENATIGELQQALAAGRITSTALVRAYLARIAGYDRGGHG